MKTIVKCKHCHHIRTTSSTCLNITCSSCGYKTPNKPMKLIPTPKEEAQPINKALTNILEKHHTLRIRRNHFEGLT